MELDIANIAAKFTSLVAQSTRIATVAHTHPDGDAIGSSLGVCTWLESLGKEVKCIFPDSLPHNLGFMIAPSRAGSILVYSDSPEKTKAWIDSCDLIIVLDMNGPSRAAEAEETLRAAPAKKVLIDHHLEPNLGEFCLAASETEVSSTSEIVYFLLKELTEKMGIGKLTAEGAGALMTGMTTDTNNFSNSTYPSTLQMASELLEMGVDRDAIVEQINWHYGENRLRALGLLLGRRLVISPEGAAYAVLYKGDMDRFHLAEGDTEGFVNMPLAVKDVRLSILLKEDKGHFRASLRSKKGTSAANCAKQYFHGGGHENAAGGKIFFPEDIPSPDGAEAYLERITNEFLS